MTRNTNRERHAAETVSARQRMGDLRLRMPSRPDAEPSLPDDLTDLGDPELMSLLTLLTRWADYSGAQLAMASVDERAADEYFEKRRAIAMVMNHGGGREDRVTVTKAAVDADEKVQEAKQLRLDAYAYRKLLEAKHEAFVRDAQVVSRELTRRVDREIPERRTNRWAGGS